MIVMLDVQQPKVGIMFGRAKRHVKRTARRLNCNANAAGIHGDLYQQSVSQVLKQFKEW